MFIAICEFVCFLFVCFLFVCLFVRFSFCVFGVGITHDVLTSQGQPIFGQEVFEWLNQPGLVWEYMEETPVIRPEHAARYDAICAMLVRFTPDSLGPDKPRLKLIARFGVGYDTIDVPTCQKAGIYLTIAPDGVRRPVAVSAITFMLMLAHKVGIKDRLTRSGRWAEKSSNIMMRLYYICWTF